MTTQQSAAQDDAAGLPRNMDMREFIVLLAALTSIVAFSIDSMLPALPHIGDSFDIANSNDRQFVIIAFMLAFGPAQLIFGPLSDAFGRRPVLLAGLALFALASVAATMADSYTTLLAARIFQGIGAASVRICSNAIVRDCFSGREMARVMSFIFTVFILVPIAAPAIGQVIVSFFAWRWLFVMFAISGFGLAVWYGLRMEETLANSNRRPLRMKPIIAAFREILSNRIALGYTLAVTLFFGGLFAFVISIQQIIEEVYGLQDWFAAIFAICAGFIGAASLANAGLVQKHGMRRISHAALFSFTFFGLVLLTITLIATPPVWLAIALISIIIGSFGFVAGNFNALAMEPLGHVAGSASSVLGTISFTGGAILGGLSGQFFNGTLLPLGLSYALFGIIAIVIVYITERGVLFGHGN